MKKKQPPPIYLSKAASSFPTLQFIVAYIIQNFNYSMYVKEKPLQIKQFKYFFAFNTWIVCCIKAIKDTVLMCGMEEKMKIDALQEGEIFFKLKMPG